MNGLYLMNEGILGDIMINHIGMGDTTNINTQQTAGAIRCRFSCANLLPSGPPQFSYRVGTGGFGG